MKARKIAQDELNKSLAEQATQLATDELALRDLEERIKSGAKYEDVFDDAMQGASKSAKEHALATKGAAGSTDVFVEKQKQAQTQLQATTKASKAAKIGMKALATVGNMFLGMAISWGISKIIEGLDNLIHASEIAVEKMDEAKSKISELNSAYEEHSKLVSESGDRYIELSNKMNSLSTKELEEFNELNKQFTEAFPDLITGFNNKGDAIANLGTNAEDAKNKLQELLEQEQQTANYEIFKNLNYLYAGTKVKLNEAIKSQKEYDDSISKANEKLKNTEEFTEFDDSISITLDYKNNGAEIRNNLMDLLDEFKRTLHEDYDDYSLDQELINTAIAIDNGTFDEYTGEQNVWFSLVNWTPEQKSLFKQMLQDDSIEVTSAIKNELANVSGALKDEIGNLTQENEKAQQEAESAWRDYTNNLANAMQSQQTFKDIGDEGLQDIAIAMVRGLDRSLYEEGQNINYDWIRNNILNGLKNLDDDAKFEVKMAYQQLLTLDPNDITPENQLAIENIINELARLLGKDPIQIRLVFGFDESDVQTKFEETMRKAYAKFGADQYDDKGFATGDTELDNFAKENSIDTEEEVEFWDQCIEESETREEAMQKYLNQNPSGDSFTEAFNAESFADSAKALKELAISGQITPEVLTSTKKYRQLLEDTGLTAEEAAEKIREIAIGESSISDIMGSLQSHAKLINKVNDEISSNGQISFDTLQSIAQSYPTLEKYVTNYLNGVEGASEDLINALNEGYKTDLDNYSEYYTIKQANDEIWWDDYVTNTNSWVNQVANAYKVDLVNYTSYLEAKQDIENRIAQAKERAEKAKSEREKAKPTLASMASGLLGATHNKNMNDFSSFSSSIEHSAQVEVAYLSKLLEEIVNSFESGIQGTTNNISDLFKSTDFIGGSSSSTSTDSHKKAFDDQLATLKHQLAMNQITEAQYYNTLDGLNKKYFANRTEYLSEYRQYEEEVYKGLLSVQKDSLDAVNDLIDLRKEMIKDMKEDEIDTLKEVIEAEKEKLDAINKSIDARKKAIELLKDEKDHDEEMAEKNKAISDIQVQIDRLALDNSASAQKKKRELEEQLAEKKKDLADYITDYEYDKAMESLDDEADIAEQEYELLEENLNKQIDEIQAKLDDEKLLMQTAINDINGMNNSLYEDMKTWALETTGEVWKVVDAWKAAKEALETYNATNKVPEISDTLAENNSNNTVIGNNAGTVNTSGGSSGTGSNNITSSNHNTSTTATTTPKSTRYHTVQSSADTMWNLAKKYYGDGTKWTKIQQANGGIDPRSLRIGQKLIIPYKKGTKKVPENQIALYDEVGEELILRANGQGKLGILTKGSSVIPADLTENLMKWGEMNPDLLTQNLNINVPPVNIPNFERKELAPVVNIGDININGNMGNLTKGDLNEFRKGIVNDVYESMQKNRVKSGRY